MKLLLFSTALLLCLPAGVLSAQPSRVTVGVLKGRIGTRALTPLQGVRVSISLVPDKAKKREDRFVPWSASTFSDFSGNYEIRNVPAGEYALCADLPNGIYLNPCHWDKPITVEVATKAKNETAVENVLLDRGTILLITLDDPSARLATSFSRNAASAIQVSVGGRTAALELRSASQLLYRITVPRRGNQKLEIMSQGFRFRDPALGTQGNRLQKDIPARDNDDIKEVAFTVAAVPL